MPIRATAASAVNKITAWSWSRLSTYETCPAQTKFGVIMKIPEEKNDAMLRGTMVHELADGVIKADRMPAKFPKELELFREEFKEVRKMAKDSKRYEIGTEEKWAFRRDWTVCGYFDKDCWVRVVVDLRILDKKEGVLTIIDHKTGKQRDGYDEQLKLYVTAGFSKFPGLSEVKTAMWYLDQGFINDTTNQYVSHKHSEKEQNERIKFWDKKTKALLSDKTFAPKPSRLCQWCSFSAANGGPCKF